MNVGARLAPIQSNGFAAHGATTYVTISRHFKTERHLPLTGFCSETGGASISSRRLINYFGFTGIHLRLTATYLP